MANRSELFWVIGIVVLLFALLFVSGMILASFSLFGSPTGHVVLTVAQNASATVAEVMAFP